MNTEIPDETPDTLRRRLITPLPDLSAPDMIPNPDTDPTHLNEHGYHPNYIKNPASNHQLVDELIQECSIWIARVFADSYTYQSDSTIDSHTAMLCSLVALNGLIYGNDQTMQTSEAIELWLDNPDDCIDLIEAANPNTGISDELNTNRPRLFAYFNLDWDRWDDDYEPRS
jgi:hypothetical protein